MLIFLVAVIPFFLHIFGFHCDSGKQVKTTSIVDFDTNWKLATQNPKEIFNSSKYTPQKTLASQECSYLIREEAYTLYDICDTSNTSGCFYALLSNKKFLADEPACVYAINYSIITINSFLLPLNDFFVFSNAYRKPDSELNWLTNCNEDCTPPPHYYWNHLDNTFTCQDTEFCGLNNTQIKYTIDNLLDNAGAKRLYPTTLTDRNINSTVKISCDGDFKPQITVFKIAVFDYKLWLAFMVLGLLFFFLSKIKEH
jgi:hypothetical protein